MPLKKLQIFEKVRLKLRDLPRKLTDATGQTLFVLIFSFAPIMGIALKKKFELNNANFGEIFSTYFSKGEICFFILSVIGAILWSVISRPYAKFWKFILLACIALIMIFTLIYVGDTTFPRLDLNDHSVNFLWLLYGITLIAKTTKRNCRVCWL